MTAGKQIYFFLSDDDQAELAASLDLLNGTAAGMPPFVNPIVPQHSVVDFSRWKPGDHDPILFRVDDVSAIKFQLRGPSREYGVDVFNSPVVEFWRCITRDKKIARGRLYFVPKMLDDCGNAISKPEAFLLWAKDIFSLVKQLTILGPMGCRIGKQAYSLRGQGYSLAQF